MRRARTRRCSTTDRRPSEETPAAAEPPAARRALTFRRTATKSRRRSGSGGSGPRAGLDPPADLRRDPVRLLRSRRERLEPDGRGHVGGPLRAEPLRQAASDLQAIRVVEPDEPVRRVKDRRERPVVATQHDRSRRPVAVLELEDVADGGAAKLVDGLIVVADDGDVAMRLREQCDELRLRAIGVLELVDEDVAEAALKLLPNRWRIADEPQRERDLVAEVDEPVRGEQLLVAAVRPRELELAARRLE